MDSNEFSLDFTGFYWVTAKLKKFKVEACWLVR